MTRMMTKNIAEELTSGDGCKKGSNINHFFNRTAGMFYFFRPCGYRLGHYEMYTAESLSNIYRYLIDLFGVYPSESQIKGIVYDRACDLHPFLCKMSLNGNEIASRYTQLHFMVDIFHIEKHTMTKCQLNHIDCQYHPKLDKFSFLNGMNTEIAEQSFKKLNAFKCTTRKMTYAKRLMYLKFIDSHENARLYNLYC